MRWLVTYRHDPAGVHAETISATTEKAAREQFMAACIQPDRIRVLSVVRDGSSEVVQDRVARENGARVMILDASHPNCPIDEHDGGRWVTWCDRHETFIQHATLADARWHAPNPTGWCGLCAEGMD